jgi:hypothetical protein
MIASRTSPGRRRFLSFWLPFGTLASLRRLDVSVNVKGARQRYPNTPTNYSIAELFHRVADGMLLRAAD